MKKLKKLIFIILIICLFIIIVLSVLLSTNNTQKSKSVENDIEQEEVIELSDNEQVELYFNSFLNMLNNNPEEVKSLVNEEYEEKRFVNEMEYNEYINKNIEYWKNAQIDYYEVFKTETYKDFICVDTTKNYYIFRENNNTKDYSIILDIYTINLEWLENKFNNANDNEKLQILLQKIENIIKCKDYKFLYEKLSNNFRMQNFKTLEDLENYITEKIKQDAEYTIFNETQNGNTYMFQLFLEKDEYYLELRTVIRANDINNFIIAFKEEETL